MEPKVRYKRQAGKRGAAIHLDPALNAAFRAACEARMLNPNQVHQALLHRWVEAVKTAPSPQLEIMGLSA